MISKSSNNLSKFLIDHLTNQQCYSDCTCTTVCWFFFQQTPTNIFVSWNITYLKWIIFEIKMSKHPPVEILMAGLAVMVCWPDGLVTMVTAGTPIPGLLTTVRWGPPAPSFPEIINPPEQDTTERGITLTNTQKGKFELLESWMVAAIFRLYWSP